jgi:Carboxypeptidase regulatory-like domain
MRASSMKINPAWFLLWAVIFIIVAPTHAQAPTATLVGRVTDLSSAVIPGATIAVRNTGTNQVRTVTTGAQGDYTVTTLDPGIYTVTITMSGFQAANEAHLELQADQTARLDVQLKVGDVSTQVSVSADVGLINTENQTKGDVITPVEISEIPLNGRDFNDLAFTVAGVQPSEQKAKGAEYVANGSRADSSGVYVDGINDEDPRDAGSQLSPPLDSVQEFRMETSDYNAEYGRLAGSVVNLAIKDGTNSFHGSAFDYIRNDLFDAPVYNFNPGAGLSPKTKLRRNQFGTDFAGPVWIPHVYNGRDKTFFNLSLEFYRQIQGENNLTTVPTLLERTGDFSQSLPGNLPYYFHNPSKSTSATCGATGGSGCLYGAPYDKIPTLDPIAQALLAYIPVPNIAGAPAGSNNYQYIGDNVTDWNRGLLKVSQKLTAKDTLTGLFDRDWSTSSNPVSGAAIGSFPANPAYGILGANFGATTEAHSTLLAIGETRIFTSNLVNDFHYGRTRTVSEELANDAGTNWALKLGISGTATGPANILGFPAFTPSGYTSIGDSASNPVTYVINDYDGSDVVTWNHHKHNFLFGGDILHVQLFQPTNTDKNGAFTYNGKFTNGSQSSDALADLFAGYAATSLLMTGGNTNHLIETNYSGFAQDDYKPSSRITLNIGLRYEFQTLPAEQNGQLTNFIPSLGKIVYANDSTIPNINAILNQAGLASYYESASQAGLPQALINTNKGRVAPRLGFAYRPFSNDKTVIRGGYGLFYTGLRLTVIRTNLAGQFPFSESTQYTAVSPSSKAAGSAFINSANPFPASGGSLSGVLTPNGYDPNAPSASLQSYNLTIERDLGWGTALEIAYAGSKGTHLPQENDWNQERIANTNSSRPLPVFSEITEMYFNGISHYDSGQVTLRRRFQHGLFFRANYTFAKSLDTQSGANAAGGGGYFGNQNVLDPEAEYGLSDFDIRHNFSATMVYRTSSRFYLLRDWQESGTVQAYSGQPFTPTVSGTQDLGVATRPNQICNGNNGGPHTINNWFNTSCFVVPTEGFGDAGRNILEGPGYTNLNLSVGRVFSLERYGSFEFRLEGFNALNHPNFGYPTAVIGSSKPAGVISSINPNANQRLVQISGRYSF